MWQNKLMRKIVFILLLSLANAAYALPDCPSNTSLTWNNCFGTLTFASGDKYVGEFKDDKYHGQGTYTYPNGDKYFGEYKEGIRTGQGTSTFNSGDKYVGEWKDGEYHGQGRYTFKNGDEYYGEYKNGIRNGFGTYTYADGFIERGYYLNGEYLPDICEDMGFRKGTSEFGQCILKLIDKI